MILNKNSWLKFVLATIIFIVLPTDAQMSKKACEKYSTNKPLVKNELINGSQDVKEGEFPHMAALGTEEEGKFSFVCSGVLISERYVLTSAYCARGNRPHISHVKFGVININQEEMNGSQISYKVEKIVFHPEFRPPLQYNNIGLLHLDRNVSFSDKISPACLQTSPVEKTINPIATNWGFREETDDNLFPILQKASLRLIDITSCNESYKNEKRRLPSGIDDKFICAGNNEGIIDPHTSIIGGPLQIETKNSENWSIIGITLFGGAHLPGAYVNISSYIKWIEGIVWPHVLELK